MMKLAIVFSMTIAAGVGAMTMPGGVWHTMGLPASAALTRPLDARPEAVLVGATLLLVATGLRRGFLHKPSKQIGIRGEPPDPPSANSAIRCPLTP